MSDLFVGVQHTIKRVVTSRRSKKPNAVGYEWHEPQAFFWQRRPGHFNFGDHLARVVVERVLHLGFSTSSLLTSLPCRVFSIGSVLHFASTGDTIWGTGRNGKIADAAHNFTSLDVRALRGPLTHQWLSRRFTLPDVLPYGDPALLIPHIFERGALPFNQTDQSPMPEVLIPNLNELGSVPQRLRHLVVDPTLPWYVVLQRIMNASVVYTSSLHGLILADAFSKPVALLPAKNEPLFKYEDYAAGARRTKDLEISNYRNMVDRVDVAKLDWDPWPLLSAFPFDKYLDGDHVDVLRVLRSHLVETGTP